ncbi:hypothetical protein [Sciscionella marina]|uniref:hypothetical protein n=1 Tax=Sciscionella marina TaxID=508770 RepID=UPI0012F68117|nr:hypothetical protein [Sciscionella marina]
MSRAKRAREAELSREIWRYRRRIHDLDKQAEKAQSSGDNATCKRLRLQAMKLEKEQTTCVSKYRKFL